MKRARIKQPLKTAMSVDCEAGATMLLDVKMLLPDRTEKCKLRYREDRRMVQKVMKN